MTFRPLPAWPYPEQTGRPDLFKAPYSSTLTILERELEYLGAEDVILGVVASGADIRLDGQLKANARVQHPGVELSFTTPKRGRMVFHTDAFRRYADSWQSNLRAIALGLEALRKVDRYGITSTDEQYAGFLQLEDSVEKGRRLVEEAGSLTAALKRWHPDQGGDDRAFQAVIAFRDSQAALR